MKLATSNLLVDLASLLKRYPSQEWLQLADLLEDETSRAGIVLFLRGIANLKYASTKAKATPSRKALQNKQEGSSRQREKQDRIEIELGRNSISELRQIAQRTGVPFGPKDSKQRLIRRIVLRRAKDASVRRTPLRENQDRAFVKWADIIMGRQRKPGRF